MNKLARNIRIAGKVFYFILIFLTIAIAMSGCEYFRMSIGKKPDDSVRIIYNVYSETFTDDSGVPILEANIVYPRIVNEENDYAIDGINHYLRDQMKAYLDIITTDGVHYARSDLNASVEAEYDFIIHTYTQMPKITYNGNGYLSILYLRMEFTGGTRSNIFLSADSFKVTTGGRLALTDFLGKKAAKTVADAAARKIRQTWHDKDVQYYDTYKRDVEQRYNTEDFYLSEKALSVFYQAETIAPYTAGFPTFDIPYNDFRMLMRVPAISGTEVPAELYIEAWELLERTGKEKVRHTVDWSSYGYEVMPESDTKAKLIIYANEETSAGPKEIMITAELVNVNGKWLLSELAY